MFVGVVLLVMGFSMISRTTYIIPPIPAGWILGVLFIILGFSLDIAGFLAINVIKKRKKLWTVGLFVGGSMIGLGIRNIINNPLELPPCPCLPGFFGTFCLPCPNCGVHSEGCNDGGEGNGECPCNRGWAGEICDRCAETFEGLRCDECKRGWDGVDCDRCYPGYTGPNCDRCDVGWIPEEDFFGALCRTCEPGRYGGYCELCPLCTTHDSLAVCKDNVYHEENVYDSSKCTVTANICTDRYDCTSLNCRGTCVNGDITNGFTCETHNDCETGYTCEFKTCCLEERLGDGTCDCGRNGYWGPLCEPCPGFDGIYSSSICGGHGTCAAAYIGSGADEEYSHLKCECVPDGIAPYPAWTGETCSCLKDTESQTTCSECANGNYGPNCDTCPGGGGISQCNKHGKCADGLEGDGTCNCDVDIKFAGLGGWGGDSCGECHSGDFYGKRCETCPNIMMVGCHTDSFLATLPGSGNCIKSCGPKVCNTDNGICV